MRISTPGRRKLNKKHRQGFTLVEMIAAIMVLALMGVGLTTGLQAATGVYESLLFTSNSETLEDTINTAFADALRYARDVEESSGTVYFTSDQYQASREWGYAKCDDETGGQIKICSRPSESETGITNWLVSSGAYAGISVEAFSLDYSDGIFSGSYTLSDGTHTKADCGFTYRNLFTYHNSGAAE